MWNGGLRFKVHYKLEIKYRKMRYIYNKPVNDILSGSFSWCHNCKTQFRWNLNKFEKVRLHGLFDQINHMIYKYTHITWSCLYYQHKLVGRQDEANIVQIPSHAQCPFAVTQPNIQLISFYNVILYIFSFSIILFRYEYP